MKKGFKLTVLLLILGFQVSFAEDTPPPLKNPPVHTETTFNNRGLYFQALIHKKFKSVPKLGIFGLTEILGSWRRSQPDEYMVQGNITYGFAKGFNLIGGFHMASGIGIRPAVGIMYTYAKQEILVVVNPRYYIDNIGNLEAIALVEYKPRLTEKWSIYSKLQGLYTFTAKGGVHARSYLMIRAGVSYKEFSFGPALNFDFYGPKKVNENSYGAFVAISLF